MTQTDTQNRQNRTEHEWSLCSPLRGSQKLFFRYQPNRFQEEARNQLDSIRRLKFAGLLQKSLQCSMNLLVIQSCWASSCPLGLFCACSCFARALVTSSCHPVSDFPSGSLGSGHLARFQAAAHITIFLCHSASSHVGGC